MLDVRNLRVEFPVGKRGFFGSKQRSMKAVDDVSFAMPRGKTLGLIGESGCGKSTLGRAILQLVAPSGGEVRFDDVDLCQLDSAQLKPWRRRMQMVFQDPYSSLNPRITVGDAVAEPMLVHQLGDEAERADEVRKLFELVGLSPNLVERFPHEFSGGQRQRIGIARALAARPDFIVCDEAVSALDVSNQAQIVNLLEDLRDQLTLTYLFIAHDLAVVRRISDNVAVMYLGSIVEWTGKRTLFERPLHPYTVGLLSAVPSPNPAFERTRRLELLGGDLPNPLDRPTGCQFHPRCPRALPICQSEAPGFREVEDGHWVACHLYARPESGSEGGEGLR